MCTLLCLVLAFILPFLIWTFEDSFSKRFSSFKVVSSIISKVKTMILQHQSILLFQFFYLPSSSSSYKVSFCWIKVKFDILLRLFTSKMCRFVNHNYWGLWSVSCYQYHDAAIYFTMLCTLARNIKNLDFRHCASLILKYFTFFVKDGRSKSFPKALFHLKKHMMLKGPPFLRKVKINVTRAKLCTL